MTMNNRIPPHSREAEVYVLGVSMLDRAALFEVMESVLPEDFYDSRHTEIFKAIVNLYNRNAPIDIITVSEELKRRQSLEMAGGRVYIASLTSDVPMAENAGEYAKIVAENALLRRLIASSNEIIEKCYDDNACISEVLAFAGKKLSDDCKMTDAEAIEMLANCKTNNMECANCRRYHRNCNIFEAINLGIDALKWRNRW